MCWPALCAATHITVYMGTRSSGRRVGMAEEHMRREVFDYDCDSTSFSNDLMSIREASMRSCPIEDSIKALWPHLVLFPRYQRKPFYSRFAMLTENLANRRSMPSS